MALIEIALKHMEADEKTGEGYKHLTRPDMILHDLPLILH